MKITTFVVGALLCMVCASVHAADLKKGVDAYEKGNYQTALRELRSLAEQGDSDAQFNLGVMYTKGEGVPQPG